MKNGERGPARAMARLAIRRPWTVLLSGTAATVVAVFLAAGIEMRMNWIDLLPEGDPEALAYRDVQERFGDPNVVIALEGDRARTTAMAAELEPRLRELKSVYSVQGKAPVDFLLRNGMVLRKERHFERALRMYRDPSLLGILRGMNEDYEREYVDDEENLRADEVEVARGVLGLARMLEVVERNLAGDPDAPAPEEGVEALLAGEPWYLSLDRGMLLISCAPDASFLEFEKVIAAVEDVERVVAEVAPRHPEVSVHLTGMGTIARDEMKSVGLYTRLLSLAALLLIYLILVRSFRGWIIPLIALAPLVAGIFWTLGILRLVFGSLNMFTAMMGLVLLGLGIDFAIHLLSRFFEERTAGASVEDALTAMIGGTGKAVIIGGLTTAASFFALLVGDTAGVYQFGFSSGAGVLLTLVSMFLLLPALLALREGRSERKGGGGAPAAVDRRDGGWPVLGSIAAGVWRLRVPVLLLFAVLAVLSAVAARHTAFEYDFLELEPAGLESVALEREIPGRFGLSNQSAWRIAGSVGESRLLGERIKKAAEVAEVATIADYLPPPGRPDAYRSRLERFREDLLAAPKEPWKEGDAERLVAEIDRLWDNLDLMSNLAYQAALDRIVKSIDGITGYRTETDDTDTTALLPSLRRLASAGVDDGRAAAFAARWRARMKDRLLRMTDPKEIAPEDLPETVRDAFLPRRGDGGFLVQVVPRRNLCEKEALDRFVEQTERIDPSIVSTPELMLVMMRGTLRDGRNGAVLALAVILLLLLIHFRGPFGLLAVVPLLGAALLMLGAMWLLRMKYDMVNLIAVPIILGIGIDDGVHVLNRFREERGDGEGRIRRSFRFIGRAILLTSVTTMIGFGSVAFYEHRGMAGFGLLLFIGVGLCFLATLFVLPAVLGLVHRERAEKEADE